MSYIDREALIDRLCYICGADCDKNICTVKQTIEYMPDVDVEPIRHGRWVGEDGETVRLIDGVPEKSCWCSRCGDWLTGER